MLPVTVAGWSTGTGERARRVAARALTVLGFAVAVALAAAATPGGGRHPVRSRVLLGDR
jgi:hypothetical protein